MNPNAFKRLALLLPIWGILLGTLVVAIPKGRIQAQSVSVYPEIQVPDEETDFSDEHFQLEEVFFQLEEPDHIIHNARHFYCRQRAIPPVLAVTSAPLVTARAVHNTGRYVLRHTAAPADVPLSSQYDYLFLLTPF